MNSLAVDKKDLLRDVQIREHPRWERHVPATTALVESLRHLDDPMAVRAWHAAVLDAVIAGEREAADVKRQIKIARTALKDARSTAEKTTGSELLAAMMYEKDTINALLTILRTLTDAVVWRLLEYNRAVIAVLGEGRATRHFASGRGLDNELATIDRLWNEHGVLAIHADLTTCVRHGDLLCLEQWPPSAWGIEECKAGPGRDDRVRRQAARLERLRDLLNTGVRPAGDGEVELRIVGCPVPMRAHHVVMQQLLDTARTAGYAETWLEDGSFAQVTDHRDPRAGVAFDTATRNEQALMDHGGGEDAVLRYSTLHRRIRDRRETFSSQLPLGLLPYRVGDVTDLCMGRMDVLVTLDTRALERRFRRRGIDARVAVGEEAAGTQFVSCERGGRLVTIPATAREQVMLEGLTLDTIVDIGDWMLGQSSSSTRRESALRFDEPAIWRPLAER
jgi:hypothetical protein